MQCDEIWAFCYAKQRNVPEDRQGEFGYGDVWTWTALDADTKLIVSYKVGPRTPPMAYELIKDLYRRAIEGRRFQLTTDGLPWYAQAIERFFGIDVDYGILQKHYSNNNSGQYSPRGSSRRRWR